MWNPGLERHNRAARRKAAKWNGDMKHGWQIIKQHYRSAHEGTEVVTLEHGQKCLPNGQIVNADTYKQGVWVSGKLYEAEDGAA